MCNAGDIGTWFFYFLQTFIYLIIVIFQQLDSVAIQNENANRYFKGIAGDRANQGELFGVKNMFQFRTGDKCLTLDIINVSFDHNMNA